MTSARPRVSRMRGFSWNPPDWRYFIAERAPARRVVSSRWRRWRGGREPRCHDGPIERECHARALGDRAGGKGRSGERADVAARPQTVGERLAPELVEPAGH